MPRQLPDPSQLRVRVREDGDVAGDMTVCPPKAPAPFSLPEEVGDRVPAGVETLPAPVESEPAPVVSSPEPAPGDGVWLSPASELFGSPEQASTSAAETVSDRATVRRDRRRMVIGAVLLIVVVAVAWAGFELWKARDRAEARAELTVVAASTSTELGQLTAEISDAQTVLEESDGKVASEVVRTDLAAVLDRAAALMATAGEVNEPSGPVKVTADGSLSGRLPDEPAALHRIARELDEHRDDVAAVRVDLAAAVDEVRASMAAYDLAQAVDATDAARTRLGTSMAAGEDVLAGSEGKVDDDQIRQGLRAALDAAALVRDAEVDVDDVDAVRAAATTLAEHTVAVESATKAVADAQTAWQSVQDSKPVEPTPAPQQTSPPVQTPRTTPSGKETPAATQPDPVEPEPVPEPQPVQPDPAQPVTRPTSVSGSFSSCSGPVVVRLAGQTAHTTVNSAGVFTAEFAAIPVGTYTFTATCDGYTASNTVEVR